LNQFYSPLTNYRDDEYGGNLENRMRFPLEVVREVKSVIDEGLLLYRLGSTDLDPRGVDIHESKIFAKKIVDEGAEVIDVSGGLCGSRPPRFKGVQGYFIPNAQEIRKVVDVPVIGVGGITEPRFADMIIRTGQVDLVAVGRAIIEDPYWASKTIKELDKGPR
jgi:2,4-dienoyl-CoA reductase-like NADH-dependent reductase (Old Yellow Enzyme family)